MCIISLMADGLTLIINNLIDKLGVTRSRRDEHRQAAAELDEEAGKIKEAIWSLAALVDDTELESIKAQHRELFDAFTDSPVGLTDAIRQVLKSSKRWMTPVAVKNAVMKIGRVLDSHRNPLGSVHTVLKRLADSNEVIVAIESNGRTLYGWGDDEEILKSLVTIFPEEQARTALAEFKKRQTASVKPQPQAESAKSKRESATKRKK